MQELQSSTGSQAAKKPSSSPTEKLIALIAPMIAPLGYEVVSVEILTHRQKTLRVFIDFLETPAADAAGDVRGIGIEDCVKVAKALDEPLDQEPEVEQTFHGPYELEVSSPGVDRPLRQTKDFERFKDRQIRVHTFRPLTDEEIENAAYLAKNPKQKNFLGLLKGLEGAKIRLAVEGKEIFIPLQLISKANIEPVFDFSSSEAD